MKRMTIDSAHSEIGFKVKHLMISTVKGNFTTYGGGLQEDGSLFVSMTFAGKMSEDMTTITGSVTIKGITKEIELNTDYNGMSVDPWGNTKHGWEITGRINRNDFGLTWNAPLETGGVLVSENVTLTMDIQMMEVVEEMVTESEM